MATKKKGRKSTQNSKESANRKDSEGKSAGDDNKVSAGKSGVDRAAKAPKKGGDSAAAKASAKDGKDKRKSSQSGFVGEIRLFINDIVVEYRKITWPVRSQVVQETYSVLVLVTLITLMVLGMDWVFAKFVFGPIEDWARYMGGGVGHG
jgi:preprotein translocase subunit SecE